VGSGSGRRCCFTPNTGGAATHFGANITNTGGTEGKIPAHDFNVCPAGYTMSGGSCTLATPTAVMKPQDGRCGVVRTGNVYGKDPQDPDCTGTAASALNLSVSGGTVTAGNGTGTLTVTVDPTTGAAVIQRSTAGESTTTTLATAVGSPTGGDTGTVLGTSSTTANGTGSLAGTGTGTGTGGDCGAPGQPACRIDETGTPTGTGVNASAKAALDEKVTEGTPDAWTGGTVAPITGLPTLSGSSSCTNPTIAMLGHDIVLNVCAVATPMKAGIEWLLYVWTALYGWRRLGGA
jgi:hypothetical protein